MTRLDDFIEFARSQETPQLSAREQWEADALAELKQWETFAIKRAGSKSARPFNPEATRGDLGDALLQDIAELDDPEAIKAVFEEARNAVTYKAIQATRLEFEGAFADALQEARDGNIDRRRWSSIVRSLIKRWGTQAYRDGLEDGGVDPDEMTDNDMQAINDLIAEQSQYVTNLGAELFKAISDGQADNKPAMWYNRSIHPFYQAGELSAQANAMFEWVIGPTEESCSTCIAANGQRHRLKAWHAFGVLPKNNGHKDIECGGFNCECNLVPTRGRAQGQLSRIPTY